MGTSKQYDLAVIGDGVAAKMTLFYLAQSLKNKNLLSDFNILQISDEKLAPKCSLKTTSTVSLNGIKEGVSELGDELSLAFFHFCDFYKSFHPRGIYPCKQSIFATSVEGIEKLKLRYKDELKSLNHPIIKGNHFGVELDSFIISPEIFFEFIDQQIAVLNLTKIEDFVMNIDEFENFAKIETKSHKTYEAKKLFMGTGAYTKIFQNMLSENNVSDSYFEKINHSKVVSGSYLKYKNFDHNDNFYFTFDDINVVYRRESKELIIGSTSVEGAFLTPIMHRLFQIYNKVKNEMNLELPSFETFEIETGLRHKGQKRRPFSQFISNQGRIKLMSGLYKNGWSLPFYYGKQEIEKFIY